MFIAHAAGGYLVTRAVLDRVRADGSTARRLMIVGLLASVAPDLDLVYFYTVDGRRHPHHDYWTHVPVTWLAGCAVASVASVILRSRLGVVASFLTAVNAMAHLALDSIVGRIRWLHPISDAGVNLVTVESRRDWWVLDFLLHWTMLAEVALILVAWMVLRRGRGPG